MNPTTRRQLNDLNRRFYRERAEEFGATRQHPWPGWELALRFGASSPAETPCRVLDVGCGNGRFARFLLEDRPVGRIEYTGLDQSRELLSLARLQCKAGKGDRLDWLERNLFSPDAEDPLPDTKYDLVVAFGMLHHVPGFEMRKQLLQALARRVGPRGRLIFTVWLFERSQRFRDKIVPWAQYNRDAREVIDSGDLEPGDYVMSFGPGDGSLRYCHASDDAEIEALTLELDLEPIARFTSDGDLNSYHVLQPVR